MAQTPRGLLAGNWKMNGLQAQLNQIEALATRIAAARAVPKCDLMICPPATLLAPMAEQCRVLGVSVALGGQDCHALEAGACTGDVSAQMLADAGASAVIVGHSERRADHGETDGDVRAKAKAAWGAGLTAILCVGEALEDRDAGRAEQVVGAQLSNSVPDGANGTNLVVAYEPVWAIGTGRTPEPADVETMHGFLRAALCERFGAKEGAAMRLLYGGSVKPANAGELMQVKNVDGALVGGASLNAEDFWGIARAFAT
ncbi:MAG: triose-phosphate isomerase [Alphaproteobacteria bacterium]